ncbi:hypothetical protein [Dapis sp. BLCC M229]|uniref:hypothetical protein n=1 Tax=Dapis sp. BLCC M229 TaxID=3400188 RepID=UPI003CE9EE8C
MVKEATGVWGDWEIGRLGDWGIGRLGDWGIGRWGDGEMGRWGEIKKYISSPLPCRTTEKISSPYSPIPFLTVTIYA